MASNRSKVNAKRNFDETLEAHVNLGVDRRHSDLGLSGTVVLPRGTGKSVKVAVFGEGSAADEAKAAGADVVGKDELIEEIKTSGKINFGKYVATHSMMQRVTNETSSCRLCALPSELLKAIIHKMDFKESVRASILSKVFRDLWHGIEDIKISDKNLKALKEVNVGREGGGPATW